MQADLASQSNQNVDHDVDSDSLFGSPPPSPRGRGRSPSPLALPGVAGSAQNVGTLALPGSHLVAEASVRPSALLPLSVNDRASNVVSAPRIQRTGMPGAQPVRGRPAAGHVHGDALASSSRASSVQRKSRKGKEKARGGSTSRSSTPRPAAPPIPIPSPDQPVPPNFLRNQQALLGVAGLVGGVNPSQLALQPGTSASHPIVVDDEDSNDQPRFIGRRPLADRTVPPLPAARGSEVFQTLAQQGNVIPLVESLVRLLTGTANAAVLPPRPQGRTGWERLKPSEPPPLKRRKLNSVPAGASDWDVPYPFEAGQGPADYQSTWAKERARRLVRELVTLVRDAAKKAAVRGYLQEQDRARKRKWMDERGWQGRVEGHYKGKPAFLGLEDGLLHARARSMAPTAGVGPQPAPSPQAESSTASSRQTMSEPPLQSPPQAPSQSMSATSINQWLASMLASTPPAAQEQCQAESGPPQVPQETALGSSAQGMLPVPTITVTQADSGVNNESSVSAGSSGNNQYFDDWLALLESIPPGDPNDAAALPDLRNVLDDFTAGLPADGFSPTAENMFDMQSQNVDSFSEFLCDPTLFDMPVFPDSSQVQTPASASAPIPSSMLPSHTPTASHPDDLSQPTLFTQNYNPQNTSYLSPIVPGTSARTTPSLTGSPLASTASLADAEQSPATPEWAWAFGEPSVVGGGGSEGLLGGVGSGVADTRGEGIVVGEEEMRDFEKVLEEACGPMTVQPTNELAQEKEDASDMMEVDSVAPSGSFPIVAQECTASAAPVPSSSTEQGGTQAHESSAQQPVLHPAITQPQNGGQVSPSAQLYGSNASQELNSPLQWLSTVGQALVGQHGSTAASQSVPPAFAPVHSAQPAAGPSAATGPGPLAVPGPSALLPPSAPLGPYPSVGTSTSSLNALSSLLALTNASKPASANTSRLTRAEVLQRAKAMRHDLERARERARVELWETTMEGACLVGLGRELAKGAGNDASAGMGPR